MENLEIQVKQELGSISTNFKEVEKELRLQMSAYENFVVSEDEINIAKGDLAFLRKLKTSIEDKRKAIKKEYLVPYNNFEESCKKLTAIIDKPIETIDSQLKLFEEERKANKKVRIEKLYEEQVSDLIRYLPFEKNFNEKWLNKSATDQDICFDISALKAKVKNDLGIIESLNSEIHEELLDAYIKSGNDLAIAIKRNQQYLSDKQKVVEQVKATEQKVEPAPTNPEPQSESAMQSFTDFAQMVRTAKIIIPYGDLAQVKETLDFMGVKYQVEGE